VVALTFIPAEVYARFVDEERNDFAAWVEYSFGEKEVADAMRTNSEPEHMRQAVLASFGG